MSETTSAKGACERFEAHPKRVQLRSLPTDGAYQFLGWISGIAQSNPQVANAVISFMESPFNTEFFPTGSGVKS